MINPADTMHRRRSVPSVSRNDGAIKTFKKPKPHPTATVSTGVLALLVFGAFYWLLLWIARTSLYKGYIAPVPKNASLDKFSEERAMQHVWHLAHEIGGRQEGTEGLVQAAHYLKAELNSLRERASSIRFEIDESFVSGSFNMHFLRHNIALAYRNHTNIAVRISADGTADSKAALLLNAHFDSPLGSPGAGDCASCVASLLEVLRYLVDTNWKPPVPVIFLFNGAEEVFLVASHGFITTHKWRSTIGAAINVEAGGSRGPDFVVQSGPEKWPIRVYAESAVIPAANSIGQDIFPLVPGDTDYRIFSQDFGDIPGLDTVFLLNGYVYHTGYDRPENVVSGGIQTRGENLIGLVKGFTTAKELKTAAERAQVGGSKTERHVFFDFIGIFMVYYSRKVALVLHALPLLIVIAAPYFAPKDFRSLSTAYLAMFEGGIVHGLGCFLAVIFPVTLAILRTSLSSTAMTWFAQPVLAVLMFVPAGIAGLLLPRVLWVPRLFVNPTKEDSLIWAAHWGALSLCAVLAAAVTFTGAMSGYFTFWWTIFMVPALSILRMFQQKFGRHSIWSIFGYILPAVIPAAYSIFFGSVLVQLIAERLGMVGAHPDPIGFLVGDIVIAVSMGLTVVTSMALVIPGVAHFMAKPRIVWLLLIGAMAMSAISSSMFPYSVSAPKRIVLQHTFQTAGDTIRETSYDFATLDPNSMKFVFKHAPLVMKSLHSEPRISEESASTTFLPLYPISTLLSHSFRVPVNVGTPYKGEPAFPKLRLTESKGGNQGSRRIVLELDLGMLQEVWGAAINITGPLVNWSFSDQKLPAPETVEGGPPSYICRFSGRENNENWKFWIEANGTDPVRIELGVLDQRLEEATLDLVHQFPPWAAVVAGTSYLSSYTF